MTWNLLENLEKIINLNYFSNSNAAGVSSASNPNYIDHQNMLGLNEATIVDHQEEPIFVPHREKVRICTLIFF